MLTLSAIALVMPAAFRVAAGATPEGLGRLSVAIAVVLIVLYAADIVFRG